MPAHVCSCVDSCWQIVQDLAPDAFARSSIEDAPRSPNRGNGVVPPSEEGRAYRWASAAETVADRWAQLATKVVLTACVSSENCRWIIINHIMRHLRQRTMQVLFLHTKPASGVYTTRMLVRDLSYDKMCPCRPEVQDASTNHSSSPSRHIADQQRHAARGRSTTPRRTKKSSARGSSPSVPAAHDSSPLARRVFGASGCSRKFVLKNTRLNNALAAWLRRCCSSMLYFRALMPTTE